MISVVKLITHEGCDSCSAKAYFKIIFKNGGNLYFCGHHYTKNKEALDRLKLKQTNKP